jgi:hypothetical protein
MTAESASSWTTRPQMETHTHTHTHDSTYTLSWHNTKTTTRTTRSKRNILHIEQTTVKHMLKTERLPPRRHTKFSVTNTKTHTQYVARKATISRTNGPYNSLPCQHTNVHARQTTTNQVKTTSSCSQVRQTTHRRSGLTTTQRNAPIHNAKYCTYLLKNCIPPDKYQHDTTLSNADKPSK